MSISLQIEKKMPDFLLQSEFDFKEGVMGFLGASGSGKSMTLRCIAGLETPSSGVIEIGGNRVFDSNRGINVPPRKRKVGYLFQNYALFPHKTVEENLKLVMEGFGAKRDKIYEHLEMVHLKEFAKAYPWQLSGGQQQRVALARVLITEPEVLLLDEPFSALDNFLKAEMERELLKILAMYKGPIIFVTHDIGEAYRISKEMIIFKGGKNFPKRDTKDIFENPCHYEEAKITGCKNISKARKISENVVYAEEWDTLLVVHDLPKFFSYVGIRAHHIRVRSSVEEGKNVLKGVVVQIIENPFHQTIMVELFKGGLGKRLQIDLPPNHKMKEGQVFLELPSQALLIF